MTALALATTELGICDPTAAVVRADDEALLRGRAAFETMRVYSGVPFRLDAHLDRLVASAASIGLPPLSRDELERVVGLVLPASGSEDVTLRLVWTAGPEGGRATGIALITAIPDKVDELRARGSRIVSLLGVRAAVPWLLPGVKSTSYAVNMAAEAEAKRRGADDAIFVDPDGVVLEGTVTNVWWRVGDVLHTPSLELGILAGVTRAAVLELAPGAGFGVEEGTYRLREVLVADEVFTSSSVRELMPVVELDGQPVPRGPAADALQNALRAQARAG